MKASTWKREGVLAGGAFFPMERVRSMRAFASAPLTVTRFCLLVFALSAGLWLLDGLIGAAPDIPVNLPVSSLMAFCPLIAACLLAYRREGGRGIRDLFRRLADWRAVRSKVWYGPALFLMPAVLFVSWACMTLLDYPLPEPDLHAPMIPVLFAVFLVAAAGEEAGWMPFVVDPLQERYGAWAAGAICGAVWGYGMSSPGRRPATAPPGSPGIPS